MPPRVRPTSAPGLAALPALPAPVPSGPTHGIEGLELLFQELITAVGFNKKRNVHNFSLYSKNVLYLLDFFVGK